MTYLQFYKKKLGIFESYRNLTSKSIMINCSLYFISRISVIPVIFFFEFNDKRDIG